ncbi:MAG: glycosyltransferase [Actinomycetota bacterium]
MAAQPGAAPGWGANVIGYLRAEMGIGEAARQVVAALEARRVPVRRIALPAPYHREEHEFEVDSEADLPVNLVCVTADSLPELAGLPDIYALLRARYSVGLWWWEVSRFPASMRPAFDLLDEVWVGSEHVANAVRTAAPVPVEKIVLPVQPTVSQPIHRAALGLPDGFLFLFVFDYRGVARRKNALGLVEAFTSAFEPGEGPQLVVKCVNPDAATEAHAELRSLADARPDVSVLEDYVSSEEKNAMIAACDCYVSLHRSEGFGQTLAEAMYFERPVIATGYSGNLEFMTPENSYLVDYELSEIGPGADPYPAEAVWAEPDLEHAAELMRRVFETPDEAAERGRRGAEDIRRTHSPQAAGRAMERRLRELGSAERRSRLVPAPDDEPSAIVAREARSRIIKGPREGAGAHLRGPMRRAALRLMRPWTVHQRSVDLMLVSAIDQLGAALRDLEPARAVAEGWRAVPGDGGLQLTSFEHPVAGRVVGYSGAPPSAAPGAAATLPPQDAVKESRRPYLELLAGHAPVLDAGCGRGELLDLLRDAGIAASGVEPSEQAAEVAQGKGHRVARAGIAEHLESLPEASLGAIFSGVALGLEAGELARFLALARARLQDGGLLLVESPNPHVAESLKFSLAGPSRSAPLLPEVGLVVLRAAGFPEAFAFHPDGSGDAKADRHSARHYALAATAPEQRSH